MKMLCDIKKDNINANSYDIYMKMNSNSPKLTNR